LLKGLWITISLGVSAIVLGAAGGLLLALLRLYAPAPVRVLAISYINVFRAIPLLVLLIVIYYALPFVGLRLNSFTSATMALSLVSAAYSAEILRAGIEGVPRFQSEAARALGLSRIRQMTDVILPQAIKLVIPPLTSNSINVMKDTSLASVVAMPDLLKQATQAEALAANPTPLISAALIYIVLLLPFVSLVGVAEIKLARRTR
jgi:polar amino acid transport system permease protein